MSTFSVSKLVSDLLQGIPANAVLRERLTLAMEQKVAAEAEAASLRMENERLVGENDALKRQLAQHKAAVPVKHEGDLEPEQEKILQFLAELSSATADVIARNLQMKDELTEYHLTELQDKKLIDASYSSLMPTVWSLEQEGRRYLVKRKML